MEFLDRYLEAVKKHLPWERQDDIIAELRANLEAQLEDKEAELGRPLTATEAANWIKQFGHPIQAAARYQPQRYLIGPALFPFYWYVLGIAIFWTAIAYVILSVVRIATQTPSQISVLDIVLRLPGGLLQTAAWVTAIFALIEFAAMRRPDKFPTLAPLSTDWSPSTLPPLQVNYVGGKKPRSYANAVGEVVFRFIFLVWLLLIPGHPFLLLGPGAYYLSASPFQLATVLLTFYWWVVALNVLQLGWRCVALLRGSWRGSRRAETIAVSALGLIPLGMLLAVRDHAYVLLKHPAVDQAQFGAALTSINLSIQWSAVAICVIAVLRLIWEAGRMGVDAYRRCAAEMK